MLSKKQNVHEVNSDLSYIIYSLSPHSNEETSTFLVFIFSFSVNENFPSRAKFGPRLLSQTWLLYPLSSLCVYAARKAQHLLESASALASLLIIRLFSPLLFPLTLCGYHSCLKVEGVYLDLALQSLVSLTHLHRLAGKLK